MRWLSGLEVSTRIMLLDEEDGKKAVLRALLDDHSRLILLSTLTRAKSISEIMRERNIPMTSAYRRVEDLKQHGLLKVERMVLTEDGKKYALVRSAIRAASVRFDNGVLEVDISPNIEADEKLLKRFFALKDVR